MLASTWGERFRFFDHYSYILNFKQFKFRKDTRVFNYLTNVRSLQEWGLRYSRKWHIVWNFKMWRQWRLKRQKIMRTILRFFKVIKSGLEKWRKIILWKLEDKVKVFFGFLRLHKKPRVVHVFRDKFYKFCNKNIKETLQFPLTSAQVDVWDKVWSFKKKGFL